MSISTFKARLEQLKAHHDQVKNSLGNLITRREDLDKEIASHREEISRNEGRLGETEFLIHQLEEEEKIRAAQAASSKSAGSEDNSVSAPQEPAQ